MNRLMTQARVGFALVATLALGSTLACAQPVRPLPRTPLIERAEPAVFAHVMVSFRTPAQSDGQWRGWDHSREQAAHDPTTRRDDGRLDIPSVFYPAIGPYDMTDPHTAAYHCQLLKMAGVDGFMFDLGFYEQPGDTEKLNWQVEAMRVYREAMRAYGLQAVVIYEDKFHWSYNKRAETRQAAVRNARADMDHWLEFFRPLQYRIGDRPLMGLFSYQHDFGRKGMGRLKPNELADWMDSRPAGERPVLITQWLPERYDGVHDGPMMWILQEHVKSSDSPLRKRADLDTLRELVPKKLDWMRQRLASGAFQFAVPGAWPGFDDRGVWGWGNGPRYTPRLNGDVYRYTLRAALATDMPVVQLVTWNDWFEGSIIEPSAEHGVKYLRMTRRFSARHKGTEPSDADLRLPIHIYRIRKATSDPAARSAMNEASGLIQDGRFKQAQRVVKPWLRKLNVDEVQHWPDASHESSALGE